MDRSMYKCTKIYITVGISLFTPLTCCVGIDITRPTDTINPLYDRKYIVCKVFILDAPKKIIYSVIISNLLRCHIEPCADQVKKEKLLSHQYYSGLPGEKLNSIIDIIRQTLQGVSLMLHGD